jgi:hypothetical protein
MADVYPLLLQSWDALLTGNLPPADVIKLLISKVCEQVAELSAELLTTDA